MGQAANAARSDKENKMSPGRQLSDLEFAQRAGVPVRRWQSYTESEITARDDESDELDVFVWPYSWKISLALELAKIMGGRRMFAVIH
jgi:hypothetical protein